MIVGFVLLLALANFFLWKGFDRYALAQEERSGVVYQLDKRTGQSWMLIAGRKVPVREVEGQQDYELRELNSFEGLLLTGSASIQHVSGGAGTWSFAIHNGLDSAIEEFVIAFSLKDSSSTVLWTKDFKVLERIEPLSSKIINLQIPGTGFDSTFEWSVKKALTKEDSKPNSKTAK